MTAHSKLRCLILALVAGVAGMSVGYADTKAGEAKSAPPTAAREKAKKTTTAAPKDQDLMKQLSSHRDSMIAEQEELQKQYREASEEKRKEILKKIQDRQKEFEEALTRLHKQIRDEQRKQRQHAAPKR